MQDGPNIVDRIERVWLGVAGVFALLVPNPFYRRLFLVVTGFVAAGVLILLSGCSGREEQQSFKPTKPFVVTFQAKGDSMLGTFPPSHVAAVDVAYPYDDLQAGDIVLRWDYVIHDYTLHRLVSKDGDWWTARGDNNPSNDTAFVTPVTYVGKYVDSQPNR